MKDIVKDIVVDLYQQYLMSNMDYQFPLDMWQDGHVYIEMDFKYDGQGNVVCSCHDESLTMIVNINMGVTPIIWYRNFELSRYEVEESL